MKPKELVAVGDAPLVAPPDAAVSCRFRFDVLSVLLKSPQYFRAVVDFQDPVNFWCLLVVDPTGFEYDSNYVIPEISVNEL